ncbi:DUF836-domain-containing protein [Salix suchowensis]|nr:DUF836-domain-containing protein [Salix suchowensis]
MSITPKPNLQSHEAEARRWRAVQQSKQRRHIFEFRLSSQHSSSLHRPHSMGHVSWTIPAVRCLRPQPSPKRSRFEQEVEDDEAAASNGTKRVCFNCGVESHAVYNCPKPRNHELIALSLNPSFNRLQTYPRSRGLETAAARMGQLVHSWRDTWGTSHRSVGTRCTPRRRVTRAGVVGEHGHLGYPPGWAAPLDPQEEMRRRIMLGDDHPEPSDNDHHDEPFQIYGEDEEPEQVYLRLFIPDMGLESHHCTPGSNGTSPSKDEELPADEYECSDSSSTMQTSSSREGARSPSQQLPFKRWAKYPTTHFASELLPIYNGNALPAVQLAFAQDSLDLGSQEMEYIRDVMWYEIGHNPKSWNDSDLHHLHHPLPRLCHRHLPSIRHHCHLPIRRPSSTVPTSPSTPSVNRCSRE